MKQRYEGSGQPAWVTLLLCPVTLAQFLNPSGSRLLHMSGGKETTNRAVPTP